MVCTPHQRQVTFTQAKRLCCLNVCIAFIASIPQLLLQGIHSRRTPIPDIVGHHCQVDDSYVPTVWPGLSSAFLFLFFVLSCTTVTYMYFHIRIKVKSQRNKFQKRTRSRLSHIVCELTEGSMVLNNTDIHSYHTTAVASSIVDLSCISKDGSGIDIMGDHNFAIENDSIENVLQTGNESDVPINCPNIMSEGKHVSINDCIVSNVFMTSQNSPESRKARLIEKNKIIEPIVLINNQDSSVLFDSLSSKHNNCVFPNDSKTTKTNMFPKDTHMDYLDIPSKREVSSNRINLVMFIVTLVYFLAFIPFLALNVFSAIYPETVASLEGVSLAFYMLFLDSYFLNCAVNPLVYSLLDNKFKKLSLELLSCCQ
ncbi:uncharacterized protein LOC129928248 [Biomphalaria glabrata]|uniref:Uncharacterized protein LOC129928248 n=1 Tax=Biomphalaria glabrata TaxID=6526 RepID=A0A9W3BE77_BIOGL|nr:uncharacterized protein LOC129928248 [Biomphalaria glabrata]